MRQRFWDKLREMGFATYAEYLASDHWAEVGRLYRVSGLPQHCLACKDPRFQLHHRSYARLGQELVRDLIPLCGDCHRKVHEYLRTHPTQLAQTQRAVQKVFGWTRGRAKKAFRPFNRNGPGGTKPGWVATPTDGEKTVLTPKQRIRELRRADPTNPAFWTPKQKVRVGVV